MQSHRLFLKLASRYSSIQKIEQKLHVQDPSSGLKKTAAEILKDVHAVSAKIHKANMLMIQSSLN